MILLAFDPSVSTTGYAALKRDGSENGDLLEAGLLNYKNEDRKQYVLKLTKLTHDVRELIEKFRPTVVIVELPTTHGHSHTSDKGQYQTGQPIYGTAVGACIAAAVVPIEQGQHPPKVIGMHADVWPRRLPGTRNDLYKRGRVMLAAQAYGRRPEDFGAKTVARDVADAVLLARAGMWQLETDERMARLKNEELWA